MTEIVTSGAKAAAEATAAVTGAGGSAAADAAVNAAKSVAKAAEYVPTSPTLRGASPASRVVGPDAVTHTYQITPHRLGPTAGEKASANADTGFADAAGTQLPLRDTAPGAPSHASAASGVGAALSVQYDRSIWSGAKSPGAPLGNGATAEPASAKSTVNQKSPPLWPTTGPKETIPKAHPARAGGASGNTQARTKQADGTPAHGTWPTATGPTEKLPQGHPATNPAGGNPSGEYTPAVWPTAPAARNSGGQAATRSAESAGNGTQTKLLTPAEAKQLPPPGGTWPNSKGEAGTNAASGSTIAAGQSRVRVYHGDGTVTYEPVGKPSSGIDNGNAAHQGATAAARPAGGQARIRVLQIDGSVVYEPVGNNATSVDNGQTAQPVNQGQGGTGIPADTGVNGGSVNGGDNRLLVVGAGYPVASEQVHTNGRAGGGKPVNGNRFTQKPAAPDARTNGAIIITPQDAKTRAKIKESIAVADRMYTAAQTAAAQAAKTTAQKDASVAKVAEMFAAAQAKYEAAQEAVRAAEGQEFARKTAEERVARVLVLLDEAAKPGAAEKWYPATGRFLDDQAHQALLAMREVQKDRAAAEKLFPPTTPAGKAWAAQRAALRAGVNPYPPNSEQAKAWKARSEALRAADAAAAQAPKPLEAPPTVPFANSPYLNVNGVVYLMLQHQEAVAAMRRLRAQDVLNQGTHTTITIDEHEAQIRGEIATLTPDKVAVIEKAFLQELQAATDPVDIAILIDHFLRTMPAPLQSTDVYKEINKSLVVALTTEAAQVAKDPQPEASTTGTDTTEGESATPDAPAKEEEVDHEANYRKALGQVIARIKQRLASGKEYLVGDYSYKRDVDENTLALLDTAAMKTVMDEETARKAAVKEAALRKALETGEPIDDSEWGISPAGIALEMQEEVMERLKGETPDGVPQGILHARKQNKQAKAMAESAQQYEQWSRFQERRRQQRITDDDEPVYPASYYGNAGGGQRVPFAGGGGGNRQQTEGSLPHIKSHGKSRSVVEGILAFYQNRHEMHKLKKQERLIEVRLAQLRQNQTLLQFLFGNNYEIEELKLQLWLVRDNIHQLSIPRMVIRSAVRAALT